MFENSRYLPVLGIRPAELEALRRLPERDKDALLPIICLKKWHTSGALQKSTDALNAAFGERPVIMDLGTVGNGAGADVELLSLLSGEDDHRNWRNYLADKHSFIPTLQLGNAAPLSIARQAQSLLELGRGLVIRLPCHSDSLAVVEALADLNFEVAPLLLLVDGGQIKPRVDIPGMAVTATAIMSAARETLDTADLALGIAGSSWPSLFTTIDRVSARIEIRERQLHSVVAQTMQRAGWQRAVIYGDYASVFAGQKSRGRASGAQRVDYPLDTRWLYHRREQEDGFAVAAQAIMAEDDWEHDLELWGAECIRRAARGDIEGLHYQGRWTAVRINLHLHTQAHYGAGRDDFLATDEPWQD